MKPMLMPLAVAAVLATAACQPPATETPAEDPVVPSPAPAPAEPVADDPPAPAAPSQDARWDGLASATLGMDEAALREAWPAPLDADDFMAGNTCRFLYPRGAARPASPAFMFDDGRLVRYDVVEPDQAAPGGGMVGMQRAEIERLYPGIEARPHAYVAKGHYLRAVDGENVLVFETDAEGIVTQWRVGRAPQVDYVEGCS